MKRLIAFALLICLLLSGCGKDEGRSSGSKKKTKVDPSVESTSALQPSTGETVAPAQPSTGETVAPTQPEDEQVTIYLVTETIVYDSGSVEYIYDENFNIDSYTVYDLEGKIMYQAFFEEKDANGMASSLRTHWPDDGSGDVRKLTWSADGKLQEVQNAEGTFTGYQYAYDAQGRMTEKREYYEGILELAVFFEYEGQLLKAVYGEDKAGFRVFECLVENGLVTEKNFFDDEVDYGYGYRYDEAGHLTETTFSYNGEALPGDQHTYMAVVVDAQRAAYLLEQQKYLIPIA